MPHALKSVVGSLFSLPHEFHRNRVENFAASTSMI